MATFKRLEEIEAWKKARELVNMVYDVTGEGDFARDFGLRDQIRRASVSIMSNIAEGFERDGTKEFIQFLSTAKGSIGEVKSQLYIASDQEYLLETRFRELIELADETGRIIAGLIIYLKKSGLKGTKFR